jgi:hypothetical protein
MPIKKYTHTTYAVECNFCDNERLDVEKEDFDKELDNAKLAGWEYIEKMMEGYRFLCPECKKNGRIL